MATNQVLIDRLRSAMKDTPPSGASSRVKRSDATYASFLTDAQSFLNEELELCRKEFTINLSADVREGLLDTSFIKFPSDRMKKRAGLVYWSNGNLEPVDQADLDDENAGWRGLTSSTPRRFYVRREKVSNNQRLIVGLDRAPNSAFVSDVPSLTYYGVYRPADIAANSTKPFDNSEELAGLDNLLIQHALVFLEIEDGNLAKASERWTKFLEHVEATGEKLKPGVVRTGKGLRFDQRWKL